jgi:microcystin-dependent protein
MSEPFLAEIKMFGFNFPPRDWAWCDGQLLPIAQNQALFSLLGTTYGGDGRTTFGLPDLRGRVPVHEGSGTPFTLGSKGGEEDYALTEAEVPEHDHTLNTSSASGDAPIPLDNFLAAFNNGYVDDTVSASTLVPLRDGSISTAGSSAPVNNLQPCQVVAFAIALSGQFPSRS